MSETQPTQDPLDDSPAVISNPMTRTLSTVFYVGATGYIGGAVLTNFVKTYPSLKITALVRNPSHVEAVRKLGVDVVNGSFSDTNLISERARAADITVNTADSDDVTLTSAILAGQRARVVDDGKPPPVLLHTSGVAVFSDGGKEGKHDSANSKVWDDSVEADIRSITPQMLHGPVDVPILKASEEGNTESYIVCPAAVVGPSTGPVPAASLFFNFNTQFVLALKKPVYVGQGENVFHTVRLDDLVELYRLIFARILSGADAKASPYSRYYIAISTPVTWKHIMTVYGGVLARLGKLENGTTQSVSADSLPPPASLFLGASQHLRGERAKGLGWRPRPVVLEDWAHEGITSVLAKVSN